jgi:hypothetical protein
VGTANSATLIIKHEGRNAAGYHLDNSSWFQISRLQIAFRLGW